MMSREYIQKIALKLMAKYSDELAEFPQFKPAQRLHKAAEVLDSYVNEGVRFEPILVMTILSEGKDDGTAGFEMWCAGKVWIENYIENSPQSDEPNDC